MSMLKILTPILLLISTSAFALDAAYLGYWAVNTAVCRPDELAGFRITPTGMTADKTRCSFTQQTRDGDGWKVRLSCVIEGGKSTVNLRWQIRPDGHLRETEDGQTTDYVRCGAR
jgi:hypothetical protein